MHDESRQSETNAQEPDWDALARHAAGESDPAEVLIVNDWLASHPGDAELVRTVKAHSDRAGLIAAHPINVHGAWKAVQSRMDEAASGERLQPPALSVMRGGVSHTRPTAIPVPGRDRSVRRWRGWAFAAAAAAIGILGLRQWQGGGTADRTARVLTTAVGVRDSVTLSDGTTVLLAPGSRLSVAAGFDGGDRSVSLEGAAYFDVKHDDAHPFTVRTTGAEIRDIGTTFTVKTDASGGVSVAVTHGIVSVREMSASAPAAVELRAGDRGVVSAGTVAVTRGSVTDDEIAWTHGRLSYRDASLSEVQADMKRWYGINLLVADSALSRLTVTMPVQQDSAGIVSTIAAMLGAEVEQRGDTIIFRSAGRGIKP